MKDLVSIGKMCEMTQESPRRLERALDALGIEPEIILNDIPYYPRGASGHALLKILDNEPMPMIRGQYNAE